MNDETSNQNDNTTEVTKRSLEDILNDPSKQKELLDVDAIAARFGGYEHE